MESSYEAGCQKMLLNGLRWLQEHPDFGFTGYHSYAGIYGVVTADTKLAKSLDKAIIGNMDTTGAMHHAVVSHLSYIHKHGYTSWLAEIEKRDPGRIYETDEGTIDTIIETAKREWEAKLANGHNPTVELLNEWAKRKAEEDANN